MPSHHHIAHPYSCSKLIDCKAEDGTFVSAGYVYQYEKGNVYNPATGAADFPTKVACSKSAGKLRYYHHCIDTFVYITAVYIYTVIFT